jgi:hypothetical protein
VRGQRAVIEWHSGVPLTTLIPAASFRPARIRYRTRVSIPETLLTFVGAPAAIYAVIVLAVVGPGQLRAQARYRPGRPWQHAPAWFVPHPDEGSAGGASGHGEIAGPHHPELETVSGARIEPVGGASGEW